MGSFFLKISENINPSVVVNALAREGYQIHSAPTLAGRRCTLSHGARKNPKSEIELSALGGVGAIRDADRKDFCSIPTITKIASQSHKVCRRSRLPKSYESFRLDWMCVAKLEKLGGKVGKKWMMGLEKK